MGGERRGRVGPPRPHVSFPSGPLPHLVPIREHLCVETEWKHWWGALVCGCVVGWAALTSGSRVTKLSCGTSVSRGPSSPRVTNGSWGAWGPGGPAGPGRPMEPGARGFLRCAASCAICSFGKQRSDVYSSEVCHVKCEHTALQRILVH